MSGRTKVKHGLLPSVSLCHTNFSSFFFIAALDAPKDLTATEVTETTIVLEWKRPLAKFDHYRLIHVSADGHRTEENVPGSSDTHILTGLTPGMMYTISITAERGRRSSVPSTISAPTGQRPKY